MTKTVEVEVPEVLGFISKTEKQFYMIGAACGIVAYLYLLKSKIEGK